MDIQGFAKIKKTATTCKGAKNPQDFIGKELAVMDFGVDDSVMVLNRQGTAMAMFDKEDVESSFKCGYKSGVVCPPDLNALEAMAYVGKCQTRKGGYSPIVRGMVIVNSLMKGRFSDAFLWQKQ